MDRLVYSEGVDHATNTLRGLNSFRRDMPEFCDFTLYVNDDLFPCHRSVLCLHSEYFRGMMRGKFVESGSNKTTLENVNSDSLSAILDFLYTGEIEIDQTSVECILETASRLQFQKITEICVSYLRHQIDETNSLEMYNFGKYRSIPELVDAAKNFTYERLESIFEIDDVVKDMTSKEVEIILQDELARFRGEEQRIMSILKWIKFDEKKRLQEMEKLLQNIDWSRLSRRFILKTLLYYPLVTSNKNTKELIVTKVKNVLSDTTTLGRRFGPFRYNDNVRIRDQCLGGEKQSCMQEVLLLVGGLTLGEAERGDTSQPNVMCYIPRTNSWETRSNWPERKLRGYSVSRFNSEVIVTGGCGFVDMKRYNIKRCWKYDVKQDEWTRICDLIQPRSFHSSCQVNGELYAVGGAFNDKIDMEMYSSYAKDWTNVRDCAPKFVWNFAVAPCNGKIMLVGSGENSPSLVLQCYNPSIAQWNQFRSPNVPRHLFAPLCTISHDGSLIFLIGDNSQKMFVFDPNTSDWSRREDMLNLHSNGGMTTIGKTVYVTGGHWEENGYWDEMESYDTETNTWTSREALPHLWLYHSCVSVVTSA